MNHDQEEFARKITAYLDRGTADLRAGTVYRLQPTSGPFPCNPQIPPGSGPTPSTTLPTCKGKSANIVGTNGDDVRSGTPGRDVMIGLAGNDKLSGLAGKDLICGGAGKDKLKGGGGKDTLLGQKGKDALKGAGGKDLCKGGKGKDTASKCEVEKSV